MYSGSGELGFKKPHHTSFLRALYSLMVLLLLLALALTHLAALRPALSSFMLSRWPLALGAGVVSVVLVVVCHIPAVAQRPLPSTLAYLLFAPSFAYLLGWAALRDPSWATYFGLWAQTGVVGGYLLHALAVSTGMRTLSVLAVVNSACLSVMLVFLIFTTMPFLWLVLAATAEGVYGFFLNDEVRRNVRGTLFHREKARAGAAAVGAWTEALLGLFRLAEMVGRGTWRR